MTIKKKYLGKRFVVQQDPIEFILDTIENKQEKSLFCIRFTCPEITTLCPVTEQPDFGKIILDYIPQKSLLESKSLKLFIISFRNFCCFHEEATIMLGNKIYDAISPLWIRVVGIWNARGGIPIDIFYEKGNKNNIPVPDIPYHHYSSR